MENNILIVDDSQTICKTLSNMIIERLGFNPVVAYSKEEAKAQLTKYKGEFAVALLDLGLPDAPDGEVVDLVTTFKIPTIVLTGSTLDENRFRDKDIVDYVIKDGSFAFEYIISLVNKIVLSYGLKVLVVDDAKSIALKIIDLLKRYNLDCIYANDGKEALTILEANPDIRLLFTDYKMPNMGGLELTKKLRHSYSKDELSIIGVSAITDKKVVTNFLKYGANDFLNKGFTTEEFYARLSSILEFISIVDTLQDKANKDFLTGVYNRRYFFNDANKKFQDSNNVKLFMIDIDFFKRINDTYGHDIGDIAIKEVPLIVNKRLSKKDLLLSRFGGEEFCGMIFDKTDEEFIDIIENIRKDFEENIISTDKGDIQYTVSIGYSLKKLPLLDDMVNDSDKGLYFAKNNGRNQIHSSN
jgi:diguanylate cyclase (GGDEF)-like protein